MTPHDPAPPAGGATAAAHDDEAPATPWPGEAGPDLPGTGTGPVPPVAITRPQPIYRHPADGDDRPAEPTAPWEPAEPPEGGASLWEPPAGHTSLWEHASPLASPPTRSAPTRSAPTASPARPPSPTTTAGAPTRRPPTRTPSPWTGPPSHRPRRTSPPPPSTPPVPLAPPGPRGRPGRLRAPHRPGRPEPALPGAVGVGRGQPAGGRGSGPPSAAGQRPRRVHLGRRSPSDAGLGRGQRPGQGPPPDRGDAAQRRAARRRP